MGKKYSDKHELSDLVGKTIKSIEKTVVSCGYNDDDDAILKNAYRISTSDKKELVLLCEEGDDSAAHFSAGLFNPDEFQALCDEYAEDELGLDDWDEDSEDDEFLEEDDSYSDEDDELE